MSLLFFSRVCFRCVGLSVSSNAALDLHCWRRSPDQTVHLTILFLHHSFWLQSTSGRGQRRTLTRMNPAVMIIEPISARYNTGAAFDFPENFSSLRFSLEGLQTNMPYPYGYRLTCYLRRTWLDNIFKPLHEDLPRTKVVLPNMWQVVNKKTPRIVFASNDSSHKQTFSRTCKLHFVNWQWKNIK